MNKTLITEATLAVLGTSGFQVAQSLHIGGFDNLNTLAAGTFFAGGIALVQRYRMKRAKGMSDIWGDLAQKFSSRNDIPVCRTTITRKDYEQLLDANAAADKMISELELFIDSLEAAK